MKAAIGYGYATYGNSSNAKDYSVRVAREEIQISITFEFKHPAGGRGVGPSQGQVERVALDLPRNTAHALSLALQLALVDTASTALEFGISEGSGGDERNGQFDCPISLVS